MLAPDFPSTQPIVIGAHGGSGTRAGVELLRVAGVWMGDIVDPETEDARIMRGFIHKWFDPIMESMAAGRDPPGNAFQDFRLAVTLHRKSIPDANKPWGWKNPRNMWLIPFFARAFPGLRFIHMIRDARDIAVSRNRSLLLSNGRTLLNDAWTDDPFLGQLRLWAMGNKLARHFGNSIVGKENYHLIRYEDLCEEPRPVIEDLFSFVGAELDDARLRRCLAVLQPSSRLGYWRGHRGMKGRTIEAETLTTMESFGYRA